MKVKSFEDLTVWQEAHKLTLEVYKLTVKFPAAEKYGIVSQLRRSQFFGSREHCRGIWPGNDERIAALPADCARRT